jgi:MFS family permease
MYSTSYTSGIPGIMKTFHITEETIAILGITTYMLGLALGSVILAPLSEMYGRRPIYLVAIVMFGLLTIPCALAPNLEAILISRFFGAIAGSAMISNAPGTVNDIVLEKHRALAFSIWSIGPMNGVSSITRSSLMNIANHFLSLSLDHSLAALCINISAGDGPTGLY